MADTRIPFIASGGSVFGNYIGSRGAGGQGYRPLIATVIADGEDNRQASKSMAWSLAHRLNADPMAALDLKNTLIRHGKAVIAECGGNIQVHLNNL